jgi:hypothetical protein
MIYSKMVRGINIKENTNAYHMSIFWFSLFIEIEMKYKNFHEKKNVYEQ